MPYECLRGHLIKKEEIVYKGGYGVCPICGDEDLTVIKSFDKEDRNRLQLYQESKEVE